MDEKKIREDEPMNWMEVSKAIDELKRDMLTADLVEWLQRGHEILYEKERDE